MKDLPHHLKQIQKKVLKAARDEQSQNDQTKNNQVSLAATAEFFPEGKRPRNNPVA